MKTINIVTDLDFLPNLTTETVGFFLECPPDSPIATQYQNRIFSDVLLGNQDKGKKMACDLACKILKNEPTVFGISQLSIFKETIITHFTEVFRLLHFLDFLINQNYKCCRFSSYSNSAQILFQLCKINENSIKVTFPPAKREYRFIKRIRSFFASIFSRNELMLNINWILNFLDPFHRRNILISVFKKKKLYKKNNLLFLTFSKNYTNIGLMFEPLFENYFSFLVENSLTGGDPLKHKKRLFFSLYDYNSSKLIPLKSEIDFSKKKLFNHIKSISLQGVEDIARNLFLQDAWLQQFFLKHLRSGMHITSLIQHFFTLTSPRALIVGNNGHEQYGLLIAKEKKIPTLLLQHGVFGDYYQFEDNTVDYYIARGEFWRDFLIKTARIRTLIINPAAHKKVVNINSVEIKKPFVVYFSLFHPSIEKKNRFCEERDSQLLSIAHAVNDADGKLIIRFHPRDLITIHQQYIKKLYKANKINIDVQFSHKENISELVKGASAAIMYFSTVFMDCLSLDVPIISYDWLNFPHKKHIEGYGIFNFAKNLSELYDMIKRALKNELKPANVSKNLFLAETNEAEAKAVLKKIVQSG